MSQLPDSFGCVNHTIKVAAGHYVDLAAPNPDSIEIRSIAAALSKICRFGGHCPQFYSVAEHCVHAANLAAEDGWPIEVQKAILLHDAAEAYIGDMTKPLKMLVRDYAAIESRVEIAIAIAFDIDFSRRHETIKHYDRQMLKAEKTAMWPDDSEKWTGFAGLELRSVPLRFWTPGAAELNFLSAAKTLQLASPDTSALATH